jgi:glycosyltransferase involved in cell wall biosynthesis
MRIVPNSSKKSERILFVAYPLMPVSENSPGGAEQVLWTLQRALTSRGARITIAACSGSEVPGALYSTGAPANGSLGSARLHESHHATQCLELIRIRESIGTGFSLVHDHSGSFFADKGVHGTRTPMLATLHLPRSFYPEGFFSRVAPNVYFNCVSKSQLKTFSDIPGVMGCVNNGIAVERFPVQTRKENYLLWLGRICEEKGTHTALDIAEKTGMPIVIAGSVYPLAYHQSYFEYEIAPRLQRLGNRARFVKSPSFATKLELLRHAKAVVITSTAEETSSLVAMEAAACGTPVIAFRRGAHSEIIENGVTGVLVRNQEQMYEALETIDRIRPADCSEHAKKNFSAARMASDYERMYAKILAQTQKPVPAEYEWIAA